MTTSSRAPLAAVVLAAGRGTRMRSATHKVLHPIGGRPMLLHLLASLETLSPDLTVVVVGDRADQVEAALSGAGIAASICVQEPQLGTAHAVLVAEPLLARPMAGLSVSPASGAVLILFGDVPLVSAATMTRLVAALETSPDTAIAVLGHRPGDPGAYGRILATPDGSIERMVEARDATADELAVPLCNAGMMAVRAPLLFPLLARVGCENAAGEYYLPDIVMLSRADGHVARVVEADPREVHGVNSRAELAVAEALFQEARRAELMASGVTLVAPETVFVAHDTRLAPDTLVEPFVVFGPGVVARGPVTIRAHSHLDGCELASGAEVGPYARLRPGSVLGEGAKVGNFVELKNAKLGAGAKANHLSYLGDASVGAAANIGAGTITCNYDGFSKHVTTIGAGAFIGSNSALVAPVSVGDGAIVAAGTTVTADVAPDALALARSPQVEKPGWAARFRLAKRSRKDPR